MNALKKKEEAKSGVPVAAPRNEILLEEIRDLLKQKQ
jgi:large-conductance mechanosensitive channel